MTLWKRHYSKSEKLRENFYVSLKRTPLHRYGYQIEESEGDPISHLVEVNVSKSEKLRKNVHVSVKRTPLHRYGYQSEASEEK